MSRKSIHLSEDPLLKKRKRGSSEKSKKSKALDDNPLIQSLTENLSYRMKSLPRDEIKELILESFQEIPNQEIDDYCDPDYSPEDPEQIDSEHQSLYQQMEKELEKEIPTLNKILSAKIPYSEKKKALELFRVFESKESSEEDYYQLRDRINLIITQHFGLTQEEIDFLEAEESRFQNRAGEGRGEILDLKRQTFLLQAEDGVKDQIYQKILKLQRLSPDDAEYRDTREWILKALSLPYQKMTTPPVIGKSNREISAYLQEIRRKMDQELYGMVRVKEQILQIRNNQITNPQTNSCSFSLVGGVGVGKTSIARALAKALDVPCEVLSIGGASDAGLFTGSHGRFVGSSMSIILEAMARMGSSNGVLVLDEVDKLGQTPYGQQVQDSLLQILDSSNKSFKDAFLSDFPHDISNLWIICTMNDETNLSEPLRDRLRPIIQVPSYTLEEKAIIIRRYLLPKALKNVGLKDSDVVISDEGMKTFLSLLKELTQISGIRPIEKEIGNLVSKINFLRINSSSLELAVSFALPHFRLPLTLGPKEMKKLLN